MSDPMTLQTLPRRIAITGDSPDVKSLTKKFAIPALAALLVTAFVASAIGQSASTNTSRPGLPQLQFYPSQLSLFAGQANGGCSETGIPGPASLANLCAPSAVAVDPNGNTYVVDQQYNTVLKVDINSNMTVFAGMPNNSSTGSYSGDGGLATQAQLSRPVDVAVDAIGNVYIAESGSARVRVVNAANGIISTFVGGGSGAYFNGGTGSAVTVHPSGINFDPSGNLYIADATQHLILKVTSTGVASLFAGTQTGSGQGVAGYSGDGGQATAASLNSPASVASDQSGTIYIADFGNCVVRKVAINGTISTFAGTGTCGVTGDTGTALSAEIMPKGVSTNLAGDLFISNGIAIRKIDSSGNINTIAGGGSNLGTYPSLATSAGFPRGTYMARVNNRGTVLFPGQSSEASFQVAEAGSVGDLEFGTQSVASTSAAMSVVLENTGNATLNLIGPNTIVGTNLTDFAIQSTTCGASLAPGLTCAMNVTFTPGAIGARSAAISVPTNAGATPQLVVLSGTGAVAPAAGVTLSPTSLTFGPAVWTFTTQPQYATLTNNSTTDTATIGTYSATDPAAFAVSTQSCGTTLAPGASCTLAVTFTPYNYTNQTYTATGSVSITTTAPGGTTPVVLSFSLTGTGTTYPAGVSATPTSIAFGNQTEYTGSGPQQVLVLNESGSPITFGTPVFTGPFVFYQNGCPSQLPTGYACKLLIYFNPTAVGSFTGTLTVPFTGAAGSPLSMSFTGTGTQGTAALSVYPSQVNMGVEPVGTASTATNNQIQIYNDGTAPVTSLGISIGGTNASDFAETDTCAASLPLAPGSQCTATVSFTPSAAGARNAILTVTSSASGSPQTVALTGAGIALVTQLQFNPNQLNLLAGAGGACGNATTATTATAATLCNINNAAQDYVGNIYLVDTTYNVVYKIDTLGNLTVFAGTPSTTGGYSGDGGPATSATLSAPTAVAADAFGNVYISDTGNQTIREVSAGMITSYVTTQCDGARGGPGGSDHSPQVHANSAGVCVSQFRPQGLVFDLSGNLYIADAYSSVVYELSASQSYFLRTVAGTSGTAGYNGDNMTATSAQLNAPQDVAVDSAGNIYIADTLNYRVREVNASSGMITTIAGNGTKGNTGDGSTATSATVTANGVAANLAGDVFVSTGSGGIVRKIDASGNINTVAGGGSGPIGGVAATASISNAYLPRIDNSGNLLIPTGLQLLAAGPDGLLQFGSQPVNIASAPLNVTIENTGDAYLHLGTTVGTVVGTNASDFALTGSNCGYQLTPGNHCTLTVTFTPGGTGSRTASISVPTDAAGSPQLVLLQGTGAAGASPTATLTAISFGNQTQNTTSSAMSATLTNTSAVALSISNIAINGANFTLATGTNACAASLAPSASCFIYVTFSPTAVTGYNATLSVTDNATGSPQTSALTGAGTAAAAPSVTLTGIAFPNTPEGTTSSPLTATLTNAGNATLSISSISIVGTNFTLSTGTNACATSLAAGASCLVYVTFSPIGTVSYAATLSVTDNATGSPHTSALTGTGSYVRPTVTLLPATYTYPNTTVGQKSAIEVFTLTNTGTSPFTFTNAVTDLTNFSYTTSCLTVLNPGKSCTFSIVFQPQTATTFNASLQLADYGDGVNAVSTFSGTGVAAVIPAPVASLTSAITFPNTTQGQTSAALSATLSNTGNAVLTITSIALGGANTADFTLTTSATACGTVLAAGATCTISATFTPAGTSTYNATITVTDNSATPTQTTTLTGTGTAIPTSDFTVTNTTAPQTVIGGNTAQYNLVVAATGGTFAGAISFAATGLPSGATASFAPASVSPGSTSASTVMTIQTPPDHAQNRPPGNFPWMPSGITLAFLVPLLCLKRRLRKGMRVLTMALLLTFLGASAALLNGCGAGFPLPLNPTSYNITVTGTSGATTHSTTVVLTVQ